MKSSHTFLLISCLTLREVVPEGCSQAIFLTWVLCKIFSLDIKNTGEREVGVLGGFKVSSIKITCSFDFLGGNKGFCKMLLTDLSEKLHRSLQDLLCYQFIAF